MIEVGILKHFDSGIYKAGVQLAGSLTTYFDDISVAKNIPSSALVIGNYVIVAIPGGNPRDACIIATWPGGTPGGGTFLDLSDTPSSYFGQAGKGLKVNAAENALEFGYKSRAFVEGWTSGKLLTGAGVDTNPNEAALKDFFYAVANYLFYEPWKNLNGWTEEYVGSGGKILIPIRLILVTGTTINSRASIYNSGSLFDHAYNSTCDVIFQRLQAYTALTNSNIKAYFVKAGYSVPPSDTTPHIGFKIMDGEIWATNANGTTETATDTGVSIVNQWSTAQLRMIGTGTSVKFYVNGGFKAEHSTNLPDQWGYFLYLGITNQEAADKGITFRPIVVHG
jgi:hypothetical protein